MKSCKRKQKEGIVVSNKMQGTVSVRVDRSIRHPEFEKIVKRSKKYYADIGSDQKLEPGQKVRIEETRPISKLKRWRVVEVVV